MMIENNADVPAEFALLPDEAEMAPEIEISAHFDAKGWVADALLPLDSDAAESRSDEELAGVEDPGSGVEGDALLAALNPIARYLQDIRAVPLLSREDEI